MKISDKQLFMAYLIVAHNEIDKISKMWDELFEEARRQRDTKEYTKNKR